MHLPHAPLSPPQDYTAGSCGAASYIAAKIAGIVGTPKLSALKVDIQSV